MKTIRATYPAPLPRSSYLGAEIEDGIKLSFVGSIISGFKNQYDQIDANTNLARRVESTPFAVQMTPEEYGQLATIVGNALIRGGVVPEGTVYSIEDIG
jgi:hypothetical protein